jgi:hypothetical protein
MATFIHFNIPALSSHVTIYTTLKIMAYIADSEVTSYQPWQQQITSEKD